MSVTDLTRGELRNIILIELKEPATSEAFPAEMLDGLMNEFYFDIFNQPRKSTYLTEGKDEFQTVADKNLAAPLAAGATSIILNDSSLFPATGRILIDNDFIDYTANNFVDTLTCGVSAVATAHDNGAQVRSLRPLPADIDSEAAHYLNLDGLPYDYEDYTKMMNQFRSNYMKYAVFQNYIIFPIDNVSHKAILTYKKGVVPLAVASDAADAMKFSLIPNQFRVSLIVNGVVGKALYLDGQNGWQKYWDPDGGRRGNGSGLYFQNLKKFYAKYQRRIDGVPQRNSSVYD